MAELLCPSYEVTVGSEKYSEAKGQELVNARFARNMGLPIDRAEVLLVGARKHSFKKGDAVKAKIGYGDTLQPIFSGLIDNVEQNLSTVKVTALGLAVQLLRLKLNRVYLNQTAGKITTNLAQEAKLKTKKITEGINLPMYVVDEASNAFDHILELAKRCDFNTYFTEDGELVFQESGGGKNTPLQYGKEIIRVEATDFSPLYKGTRICGESPASTKGADTSHWLTKQEVKGEAGAATVLPLEDAAIRDKKTAEIVAKARMTPLCSTRGAVVDIVGRPELKLGDTVTLNDIPISDLEGELEIRSFEHYVSKARGFTTTVSCWKRENRGGESTP